MRTERVEVTAGDVTPRRKRRPEWLWFWGVYLLLLVASWMFVSGAPTGQEPPALPPEKRAVAVPDFIDDAEHRGPALRLAYREWGHAARGEDEPLILIHGSPGSAGDFTRLAPLLAAHGRGRLVIAPDLPGFGDSTRTPSSYSVRSHARHVLAMMDGLGIERAHVLGWSMGGGVALNMSDIAPNRVASLTMLAAIGDQRTEGSGSYGVEHAKYALGEWGLLGLHALTPHFGLLPEPRGTVMYSLMRNFGDTDQRALTGIMERLRTPTLIVAGASDFLVTLPAPELQHRLIGPSRLVVIDAMHFMPFLQAEETADLVGTFIESEAPKGEAMERAAVYHAASPVAPFGRIGRLGTAALHAAPWWLLVAGIMLLVRRRPFVGAAAVAALINALALDWGVGLFGVFLGVLAAQAGNVVRGWRARRTGEAGVSAIDWARRFDRSPPGFVLAWRAVFRPDIDEAAPRAVGLVARSPVEVVLYGVGVLFASAVWTLVVCLPLLLIAALIALRLRETLGWVGTGVSVLVLWLWARSFVLVFTWTGRRMLLARLGRAWRHEYWPSLIAYAPLVPYLVWLAARARHPLAFTACNPGIPGGGGVIGESKSDLLARLVGPPGMILDAVLIPEHPSPEERAAAALAHIGEGTTVGGFPSILKPDAGLRGFAVRLARGPGHVHDYFRAMTRPAMVQRFHPGPHEVGVLWARRVAPDGSGAARGFIYSITRKEFPHVEGDGRHTLEQLIYRHPRHRRQAATFLARFADDASRIVPNAERVRLAQSGNHCQGTLFRDGADLVTPELLRTLDDISLSFDAASWADPAAPGGLDIVRYDLRFESEEDLRAGRNFGIIEINGTTGESTNIYDPDKSVVWSYRVLFGQWKLLFDLGMWRRERGGEAWSVGTLLRALRAFYRDRPGSAVAD